ncbi:hypothetical protein [Agromyces ramosus]|uniref:hypothetical protein n=1 Tax=Agromyces ramosus TaxID=33879 RepID=UPI0027D9245C|nr:hypothetical protein [Agromyces ramosus]
MAEQPSVSEVERREHFTLELSSEEALVLFEWLARAEDEDALESTFVDKAEQLVLWSVEGQLEKELVAPFRTDYDRLLQAARDAVRGPED